MLQHDFVRRETRDWSVVLEERVREPCEVSEEQRHGQGERHEQAVVLVLSQPVDEPIAGPRHQVGREHPEAEHDKGHKAAQKQAEARYGPHHRTDFRSGGRRSRVSLKFDLGLFAGRLGHCRESSNLGGHRRPLGRRDGRRFSSKAGTAPHFGKPASKKYYPCAPMFPRA